MEVNLYSIVTPDYRICTYVKIIHKMVHNITDPDKSPYIRAGHHIVLLWLHMTVIFCSEFPYLDSCQLLLWTQRTYGIQHKWGEYDDSENYPTEVTTTPSYFQLRSCWATGGEEEPFVSLESVDHPGAFLKHRGYVLFLHPVTPA